MPTRYSQAPPPPRYGGGSSSIRDLILRRGQIEAERSQRSGENWSNAISDISQISAGGLMQYGEQAAQQQQAEKLKARDAAWVGFVEDGGWQQDSEKALSGSVKIWGPEEGPKKAQGLMAFRDISEKGDEEDRKRLGMVLHATEGLSGDVKARWYPGMKQKLAPTLLKMGVPAEALPEAYTPENAKEIDGFLTQVGAAMRGDKPAEGYTLKQDEARFGPDNQQVAAGPASEPKADTRGIDVRLAEAAANGDKATYGALMRLERDKAAAGRGPRTPENKVWVTRDGQPVFVPESQVRAGDAPQKAGDGSAKPSTGAQKRALAFYNDGKQAADDVDAIADQVGNSVRLKYATNMLQSEEGQKYWQGIRSFSEARLRLRSGAVIPTHEIEKDAQTYFKQPGDTDAVLKQKKASRDRVLDGIRFEAGPAYDEYYGESAPRMPATSTAPIRSTASAPKVGDRKAVLNRATGKPSGRFSVFDGRGWVVQ